MQLRHACINTSEKTSRARLGLDSERLRSGDLFVDVFALLQRLLPLDDLRDALDEQVAQLHLAHAQAVRVRDVPGAAGGGRVHARGAARLQLHLLHHVLEVRTGGKQRNLHHGASTQTRAQVGGAGQDEAEVVVVHEVVALRLETVLDGLGGVGEAGEDGRNVVALLHGDDAHLVLLVHPHEEVFRLVVVDAARIGPVAPAPGRQQQGRVRLLEQVAVAAEGLLLLLAHTFLLRFHGLGSVEREVLSLQLALHLHEALHDHALGLAPLLKRARGRQRQPAHGTTGAAAGGQDVFPRGVDRRLAEFGDVHVGAVLGVGGIPAVALAHHDVEQVLEGGEALLVTGDQSAGEDVGVSRVVDAGLDALGEGDAAGGGHVLVLLVDLRVVAQRHRRQVPVLRQIRERIGTLVTGEGGALLLADVFDVAAAQLDPLRQLVQGLRQSFRRVRHFRFFFRTFGEESSLGFRSRLRRETERLFRWKFKFSRRWR
mmetsp:Transcript_27322/g.68903  ORF Transcript_27322/g.68903 Transcript_27322/m.68903 type:complete len:485 (-) Transcript_27322:178-1632(-)